MAYILVIEDNPINMKLFRNILLKHGHQPLEARDAEQGIALARQQLPDLILMDIQLPGMDGLQAAKILKADDNVAHIPIIALTALAMLEDEGKVMRAGCDDYLSKPIRYQQLLEKINKHLENSHDTECH